MSEIIININEANKAQRYQTKEELFQIEAFKKVSKILQEHKVSANTTDITDCRFHDTIFIDGNRGVGKTAFMINIQHYYNVLECKNNTNCLNEKDTNRPKYIFLKPVDPTLLEHAEKFLGVVLARIVEKVNDDLNKTNSEGKNLDGYFKALDHLSKSLSAVKTLSDDIGIEEIASNKSSLKLEQYAHEFFREVCTLFDNSRAIVMLIDDVDMAFDKGFDVLEVVRKYLASPYLIPIVAGDMKLYREIVETRFMDKIEFLKDMEYLDKINKDTAELKESLVYKEKKELIDNLVEQYLRKIFPSEYQIQLKDIDTIKNEYKITIVLSDKLSESLLNIENFELKHINMGINREEFYFQVFSNNTRDFIQYLYSKKDIYKEYFENKEELADIKNSMNIYKNSFMKTADFYKFSHDRKKKELSILANNDYLSFDGDMYNLYKAFTSKSFSSMKKFHNAEISVDKHSIKAEGLQKILNEDDGYKDISNYIIDLFTFNDYYSSYQRRNYIYSGKFLESMIYSFSLHIRPNLIKKEWIVDVNNTINNFQKYNPKSVNLFQNIGAFQALNDEIYSILYDRTSEDAKDKLLSDKFNNILINVDEKFIREENKNLKKIAYKIPFGSEFLTNNRYKDEKFEDDDADEINESENKYDLTELSKAISIWRNVFLGNVELNSISLFEIVYKFFENIEKIKILDKQVVVNGQYKGVKLNELEESNPIIYLQRIVLMFINSIAFFESGKEKVANVNIAIGEKFNLENILSKTSASLLNIKPMFEKENSLTRALFFHPIISHILFPHGSSKLKELSFVRETSKINITFNTFKGIEGLSEAKIGRKFGAIYSKYFASDTYKEGVSIDDCYEVYFASMIELFKSLNKDEQNISKKLLSNKKNRFHKIFELLFNDSKIFHPRLRDSNLFEEYESLVYGN